MTVQLPITNETGFYEIRMESVGGLGANVAGKILGEASVLRMGLNGANFASYGAEKKGTPVKSFVRLCAPDQEVRTASPVEFPHLLAILHESLIRSGIAQEGITHDTTVVVNTTHDFERLKQDLGMCGGTLCTIDATGIAVAENSRPNMVMLGAMARASGFLDAAAIKDVITETLGHKYPKLLEGNLKAFERGHDELAIHPLSCDIDHPQEPPRRTPSRLGFENEPIGGTVANPGNTLGKDLSAARLGVIPRYDPSKCINDAHCEYTCPDFCFVFGEGVDRKGREGWVLKGIDYQHCKGCLRCVQACPTDALSAGKDDEQYIKEHTVSQMKAGDE